MIHYRNKKYEDLTGQKFGQLTVIKSVFTFDKNGYRHQKWECKCDCGYIKNLKGSELRSGNTSSCGCLKMPNLTGKKFGKLLVLGRSKIRNKKTGKFNWECQCDCGKIYFSNANPLTQNRVHSCGCSQSNKPMRQKDRNNFLWRKIYRNSILHRSKIRKQEHDLDFELFKEVSLQPCCYCGEKSENSTNEVYDWYRTTGETNRRIMSETKINYNGIDRIDSSKGYFEDNIVACCPHCNIMKWDFTVDEFKQKIIKLYNHLKLENYEKK